VQQTASTVTATIGAGYEIPSEKQIDDAQEQDKAREPNLLRSDGNFERRRGYETVISSSRRKNSFCIYYYHASLQIHIEVHRTDFVGLNSNSARRIDGMLWIA